MKVKVGQYQLTPTPQLYRHLQKFSDDSSIVVCITDVKEDEYRDLSGTLWDGVIGTTSSSRETKEQVVDLRHRKRHPTPVFIYRDGVEMVDIYSSVGAPK